MKMRRIALISLCFFSLVNNYLLAQQAKEEKAPVYGWEKELVSSLNLTQSTFDHWVQGGENTLAWQLSVNFRFEN